MSVLQVCVCLVNGGGIYRNIVLQVYINNRCFNQSAVTEKPAFCRILIKLKLWKEVLEDFGRAWWDPSFPKRE